MEGDRIRKHEEGQAFHRVSEEDQPVGVAGKRQKIHRGVEKDKATAPE